MSNKAQVSPWLRGLLALVAILFLPTFVIQLVRPDALDPHARRPTLATARFRILVDTGLLFNRLHRADISISRFRDAELLAQEMGDDGYESLQEVRVLLAEDYERTGQTADAQQAYARIVKSSMDAGDALIARQGFSFAIPKFTDAERFAQKLTTDKLAATLTAQRSLASCLVALKRDQDLDHVYIRMIATMREQAAPDEIAIGNTYRGLAVARAAVNNWVGVEEALLEAGRVYDQIIARGAGNPDSNAFMLAQLNKDHLMWDLALCYYYQNKMDLALSHAEQAFQVLSRRGGPRAVPIGVYTVGARAAIDLNDETQVQVWRQRLNDLSPTRPPLPEGSNNGSPTQIPLQ